MLNDSTRPILFIAGATGFAPVKSILEDAFHRGVQRPLSEPQPDDQWTGRTGLVHEAMLADYGDLTGFEVYVCGSLKMVETAVPSFLAHGLGTDACFSDAFLPAAAPV